MSLLPPSPPSPRWGARDAAGGPGTVVAPPDDPREIERRERRLRDFLLAPKIKAPADVLGRVARGVLERAETPVATLAWWTGAATQVGAAATAPAPELRAAPDPKSPAGLTRPAPGRAAAPPRPGDRVFGGELVATDEGTRAVLRCPGGIVVWLGVATAVVVEAPPEGEQGGTIVRLLRGDLLALVPATEGSSLRVRAGRDEAGTPNARFSVRTVAEGGGARVDVFGGRVWCRRGGAPASVPAVEVAARQALMLAAGGDDAEDAAATAPQEVARPEKELGWIGALGADSALPPDLREALAAFFPDGFPAMFDDAPATGLRRRRARRGVPLPSRRAVLGGLVAALLLGGGGWAAWRAYRRRARPRAARFRGDPLRIPGRVRRPGDGR